MAFIVLEENQEKSASQTTTVIGCLVKGDQPGLFSITGEDGKSWDLRRSTVTLADHAGHQATVTGPPTREAKSEGKKAGQVEKAAGKEELGDCAPVQFLLDNEICVYTLGALFLATPPPVSVSVGQPDSGVPSDP